MQISPHLRPCWLRPVTAQTPALSPSSHRYPPPGQHPPCQLEPAPPYSAWRLIGVRPPTPATWQHDGSSSARSNAWGYFLRSLGNCSPHRSPAGCPRCLRYHLLIVFGCCRSSGAGCACSCYFWPAGTFIPASGLSICFHLHMLRLKPFIILSLCFPWMLSARQYFIIFLIHP